MVDRGNKVNRRAFVHLGAGLSVSAGAALLAETAEPKAEMKYRILGRTGLKVSEISFGSYGFSNSGLLEEALNNGFNFVNTCAEYQNGTAEEAIGKVMKTRRKDAYIMTGWVCTGRSTKQDLLKSLDDSLKRLQTDHIEIIKSHNITDPAVLDNPAQYEAFEEAKKAGKVDFLGISTHSGNREEILLKALEKKSFDVFQFKYNFMEEPAQAQLFAEAQKQKIGMVVFKCQAGKREKEVKDLEQKGLSFKQATVRWTLAQPGIHCVCVIIEDFTNIPEYKEAVMKQFGQAEDAQLRRYADAVDREYCRYCSGCESACPYGVAVADVMRYSMYFKYYKMEKEAMRLYAALPEERKPLACKDCQGRCNGACLHKRSVREGLLEAERLLA